MLLSSSEAALMTLQCSSVHVVGILAIFRKMHCYFLPFVMFWVWLKFLIIAFIAFKKKKTLLSYNRKRVNCTYLKYTIWYVFMYIYTHVNINTVNSTNITLQRSLLHPSAISPSLNPSTQEMTDLFFSIGYLIFSKNIQ